MSLDLVREVINVNKVLNSKATQIIVENDIIVPDSKPDVLKILAAEADAYTTSVEVNTTDESILIKGIIRYKIFYKPDDSEISVKSINISAPFSHKMDIPQIDKDAKSIIKSVVEHVECEISNGRKINAKTIIQLSQRAMVEKEHILISDIKDNEDVQILRNNMEAYNFIGSNEVVYTVKDSLEVPAGNPPIREILRNDVKIINKDFRLSDNKVVLLGELNIITLYIGDDQESSVRFMEHTIAFTQFVDLPGLNNDADCEIDYEIRDYSFELEEDTDGEYRIMNGEVEVYANVWGNIKKEIDYILDAYSMNSQLNLEKKVINIEEKALENTSQAMIKDSINIGDENPEISEIINIFSKPVLTDYKVWEDKVEIEGFISGNITYLSGDPEQNVSCCQTNIPINHTIDIKGIKPDMVCYIELSTEHVNYSIMSSKDVEVKFAISIVCKAYRSCGRGIIEKISEGAIDDSKRPDKRPSIVIYFVKPEDTFWEIAKRYATTINEIQRVNSLEDNDAITPGMQILITHKSD